MNDGLNTKTVRSVFVRGQNASNINVTIIPQPNNIKSNGLNHPNINCPLFVLAGIKY
jgi:hypothetical protein